ncbi:THO complex subunit 4B [Vitis vinifera]|uniref:THO complex subunit 4B n=1 Tax=Vitis vinifera TaxID=29760 RepID=A0A438JY26_VITVI|nr:THO complex subunit 4B [Vitis vinifera]
MQVFQVLEAAWKQEVFTGGVSTMETGTKLYISNLEYGVSNDDIKHLSERIDGGEWWFDNGHGGWWIGCNVGKVDMSCNGGREVVSHRMMKWCVVECSFQELFSEVGELKQYSIHYDKSGISKGTGEVVFLRQTDALAAIKRYNNVQLDANYKWHNGKTKRLFQKDPPWGPKPQGADCQLSSVLPDQLGYPGKLSSLPPGNKRQIERMNVHCDKIDFEIMMILCPSLSVGILRNVIFFHDDIMDLSHLIVLECSFPCCYYNIKTQFQYTPEGDMGAAKGRVLVSNSKVGLEGGRGETGVRRYLLKILMLIWRNTAWNPCK